MPPPLLASLKSLARFFAKSTKQQPHRNQSRRYQPQLESLEDRIVPATGGTLEFQAATLTPTIYEGNLVAVSTVTLLGGKGDATVDYTTSDGTAIAGTDYTATSGSLAFSPGQTSQTIDVPILGPIGDADNTFYLSLSDPSGATLGSPSTQTITFTVANPVSLANPGKQFDYDGICSRSPAISAAACRRPMRPAVMNSFTWATLDRWVSS